MKIDSKPYKFLIVVAISSFLLMVQAPITANASTQGWQISMMYSGKKTDSSDWISVNRATLRTNMGSPGTSSFPSATSVNTGASNRTAFGNGAGLYKAFFEQENVTKVALVDGSSTSLDPTQHTNYLIYDLVEGTDSESLYDILKRLDEYQRTAAAFHNQDSVWGNSSVKNHTAGTNGYSGTLTSSGGTAFKSNDNTTPGRFVVMGINRDSDNDIQALAAFSGDLNTGKGDAWRGANPLQTFWSYWGHDFHSSSTTQRIGSSLQTAPGVATGATWTGDVYLLTFGDPGITTLSTPATPTADPTTGTLKSIAVSWSAVTNASSYTLKLYASNGTTLLKTIAGLNSTSRTITTSDYALADGTTYQVSITAIGNGSTFLNSSESTKRSVTTSQTLSNASLSTASATSAALKSINLSWSAIANASSYTIKIYDANDSLLATRTSISGTSKTINSTDLPAIADSTLYKFSIQAIGNNSSFLSSTESSKISATTHAPVSVSINRELTNPYSSRSIKYTISFSETITGFTTSNITLAGTSTGWSKGDLQGSGSNYSITITNSSPNDGSINLSLTNTGISAISSSVQPPSTNATAFNLGRATQVNTWIKFLWGEDLVRF
jgi:hypothetical protein